MSKPIRSIQKVSKELGSSQKNTESVARLQSQMFSTHNAVILVETKMHRKTKKTSQKVTKIVSDNGEHKFEQHLLVQKFQTKTDAG